MKETTRTRWTDVYRTETPMHAKLIAGVLDAKGLQAKVQRKKPQGDEKSVPFVRVKDSQAQTARDILAAYQLELKVA